MIDGVNLSSSSTEKVSEARWENHFERAFENSFFTCVIRPFSARSTVSIKFFCIQKFNIQLKEYIPVC